MTLFCVQGHMLGGPIYFVVYLQNQENVCFLSPTHVRIRAEHLQHFLFLSLGLASFSLQSIESNVSSVVWAGPGH